MKPIKWFWLAGCVLSILHALPTVAQQPERFEFKGIAFGSSRAAFRAKFPGMRCENQRDATSGWTCYGAATGCRKGDETCRRAYSYANVNVKLLIGFFYGDSLTSVQVRIEPDDFAQISEALIERYGKPKQEETETVVNRGGATFTQIRRTWRRGDSRIEIRKYGTSLDSGVVLYHIDQSVDEFERRQRDSAKKGAKDL